MSDDKIHEALSRLLLSFREDHSLTGLPWQWGSLLILGIIFFREAAEELQQEQSWGSIIIIRLRSIAINIISSSILTWWYEAANTRSARTGMTSLYVESISSFMWLALIVRMRATVALTKENIGTHARNTSANTNTYAWHATRKEIHNTILTIASHDHTYRRPDTKNPATISYYKQHKLNQINISYHKYSQTFT